MGSSCIGCSRRECRQLADSDERLEHARVSSVALGCSRERHIAVSVMTHSGLQREVLSLYRKLLRAAQWKQPQLVQHIRGSERDTMTHSTDARLCCSVQLPSSHPIVCAARCVMCQRSFSVRVAAVGLTSITSSGCCDAVTSS